MISERFFNGRFFLRDEETVRREMQQILEAQLQRLNTAVNEKVV